MPSQTQKKPARAAAVPTFQILGVPVFVHGSVLLIELGIAANAYIASSFVSSGTDWRVAVASCFSYTLSMAAHEFGHAAAAACAGLRVHAIHLSAGVSHCQTERPRTPGSAFLLYAGGILAHLVLLGGAAAYLALFGWPRSLPALWGLYTFIAVNLISIAIVSVPYRWGKHTSDGRLLWGLLVHGVRGLPDPPRK